ncbi:hypothetical protein ACFQFG_17395 [Methylobacterium persicinum]
MRSNSSSSASTWSPPTSISIMSRSLDGWNAPTSRRTSSIEPSGRGSQTASIACVPYSERTLTSRATTRLRASRVWRSRGPITSRRPGRARVMALVPPARLTGKSK